MPFLVFWLNKSKKSKKVRGMLLKSFSPPRRVKLPYSQNIENLPCLRSFLGIILT